METDRRLLDADALTRPCEPWSAPRLMRLPSGSIANGGLFIEDEFDSGNS